MHINDGHFEFRGSFMFLFSVKKGLFYDLSLYFTNNYNYAGDSNKYD